MADFCGCGSIKRNGKCSNKNCTELRTKKRVWVIEGQMLEFGNAVTGPEAAASAAKIMKLQEEIQRELRS